MSSQPVRVAVIGTSFASAVQIPGFQLLPGVEVVAVASASAQRAADTAERFGIPGAYGDWRELLAEVDCDVVSIVTPPYLHREMALAAIERGRHVFCEKPFASNVAEAVEMVQAVERSGLVHAVDHEFRYRPARTRLKELVDAGHLGEPRVIRWGWLLGMLAEPNSRAWNWWSQRSMGRRDLRGARLTPDRLAALVVRRHRRGERPDQHVRQAPPGAEWPRVA